MNHDGFKHNLLDIPHAALDFLLQDAWYGYVTKKVKHRKTMKDLPGIYEELTLLDRNWEKQWPCNLGPSFLSGAMPSMTPPKHPFAHGASFRVRTLTGLDL